MGSLTWYMRRLRMMSAAEIASRAATHARHEAWRRRRSWPAITPRRLPDTTYRLPSCCPPGAVLEITAQSDQLRERGLTALGQVFALREVEWGRDPQSGTTAPLEFGPAMDCRDARIVGNVRNTWELNRHQHLSLAALAYAVSADQRHAEFVEQQLTSWLAQNPFPRGVNWSSPLELGLRLISWVWIERLLTGSPQHARLFGERGLLWPSIHRHQWMIARTHATGSSANNHLLGEMAGLYVASTAWPVFRDSPAWSRLARRVLDREIIRQFYPSGVNKEQAFGYHVFGTQLLTLAALEGERVRTPFTATYLERLRQAASALDELSEHCTAPPTYGDSDESVAVGLGAPGNQRAALTRTVIAEWLGGLGEGRALDAAARYAVDLLLSGVTRRGHRASPQAAAAQSRAFHDAGLFVMRAATGRGAVRCLADAGDLGYLSLAAHGHADALAFALHVDDEALIVDVGTGSYHFDPAAREYFRSTRAHNTITVDGLDQSTPGGPFLWTSKAAVEVRDWRPTENGAILVAQHDGYRRLADPVFHRRRLELDGDRLTITDDLAGHAAHEVEWRLHLAPQCAARLCDATCRVTGDRHRLEVLLDPALEWSLRTGEASAGWYSPAFNQRVETTTLVGTARPLLPCRVRITIRVVT